MFNTMLESLKANQDELTSANKTLDLKLVEMAESNVALFEANKVKGEFLANVSHELRTPLNSIIGFAEILQETLEGRTGPVDEKRRRYAANIITSSRRLLELINDLLDIAKIEAGKMTLRLSRVSVIDTLEGLVTLIKPQAEKGNVRLFVEVAPRLPMVRTDPGKLQQIVFNFLANAVKFTPPGGTVTLRADVGNRGADRIATPRDRPTHLRIAVADTGPGISEADQDKVFDKFTQLDPGVTKTHGGTGLGLTIARELAEMLGGTIAVESTLGRGATFVLTLPIEPPDSASLDGGDEPTKIIQTV
jgi:signal transduction histidine kinase